MNKRKLFQSIGEISEDLITEAENSKRKMRRIRISKIAAIAAVIVMLGGLSVFASKVILTSREGHSFTRADYTTLPTQETLQKDIGIGPKLPEAFSNGYKFKEASIKYNTDYVKDENIFEEYKSLNSHYVKGNNKVSLSIDGSIAGLQLPEKKSTETYKNYHIYFISYENKLVPSNYKLTEQDKKDKKSGKYVFSYGNDKVEIIQVKNCFFEYDDLSFSLTALDEEVTKDDLMQISREIIDYQK